MQVKADAGDGKRTIDGTLPVKNASKIRKQNARATSRKGGAKAPPFYIKNINCKKSKDFLEIMFYIYKTPITCNLIII